MIFYQFVLFLIFSLASGTSNAEVAKCYQCTNCAEPFEPQDFRLAVETCKSAVSNTFLCRKITVRYPFLPIQVTKSCVSASECVGKSRYFWSFGESVDCCSDSLCNGAQYNKEKIYIVVLIVAAFTFMVISMCLEF